MAIMSWGHRDTPWPRGNPRFLSELQGCEVQLPILVIKHPWDWLLALRPTGKEEHPHPTRRWELCPAGLLGMVSGP